MDSNRTEVTFYPETTFNTPESDPPMRVLQRTRSKFKHVNKNVESNDIRSDLATQDLILAGYDAMGSFDAELCIANFDEFLFAAINAATPAGNELTKNGVLKRSFRFQERYLDLGGNNTMVFLGMVLDTLGIKITSEQVVTLAASFKGTKGSQATASINAAPTAFTDGPKIVAGFGIGAILIDDVAIGVDIQEMDINFGRNPREHRDIQKPITGGFGLGKNDITGTIKPYFENDAMLNRFYAAEAFGLKFDLFDSNGAGYHFVMPRVKLTDDDISEDTNNADLTETLPWRALISTALDPNYVCSIQRYA